MTEQVNQQITPQTEAIITGEAHRALGVMMRAWSGWRDASVHIGTPTVSPYAQCDFDTHIFTINAPALILNPNRVLATVTPFRLKQEAVLTGCMLHEAGHARYSGWLPRTEEAAKKFVHSDGKPVTRATVALARVLEEARIEGRMATNAAQNGAPGLAWTMRASAAHLLPLTNVSDDPDQAIIDIITSWALRAGRQTALSNACPGVFTEPPWVDAFDRFLRAALIQHISANGLGISVQDVMSILFSMCYSINDTGTYMVDKAREILNMLFPETPDGEGPMAGGACASMSVAPGQAGEGDADGGSDESATGSSEGDSDGDSENGEGDPGTAARMAELEQALADVEAQAQQASAGQEKEEAKRDAEQQASVGGIDGGDGSGSRFGGGWRVPTAEERGIEKGAERFLRDLLSPTEASKVHLSESPSATVDGAALSAWKAGGQVRDPRFFRRTTRETVDSPPVKVAILVDISGSMDVLQKPSAILSWALANAALDLRNFAGRGTQIHSTLIHWGDRATVIQRNGEVLPGIREVLCLSGTSAMHSAMDLVEEQIPGFFDLPVDGKPENRLIVQFTDWELSGHSRDAATERVHKALAAGVNMLSVVPGSFYPHRTPLPDMIRTAPVHRGRSEILHYNPSRPAQVWDVAARSLNQH